VFVPFMWVVPSLVRLMGWVRPGIGSPAYLPSSLLRYITFKLSMDLDHIPGLNELTRYPPACFPPVGGLVVFAVGCCEGPLAGVPLPCYLVIQVPIFAGFWDSLLIPDLRVCSLLFH
jgi:hypothetical protein